MTINHLARRKFTPAQLLALARDNARARWRRGRAVVPVRSSDGVTPYPTTYPYGVKSSAYAAGRHTGEDHACPVGSLAVATAPGTVEYAGPASARWGSAYGNQVIVRTADNRYDYAHNHLSSWKVSAGQKVQPGDVLGLTGATGNVTGPHSHFEARAAGGRYGSDVHPIRVKVNGPARR
ncbi:M23 family metallopeptidase, partial [Nocardioides hankookensis]